MQSANNNTNMATITMQRDLIFALKKETCLNIGILSKLQPMSSELSRQIFKENALEKPTQHLFNQLSHYLVSIIDSQACVSLPWPLYDTKTERAYRNELSNFISEYGGKGLLTPVMSSYLVNPGCYKVTMLIFQLSQLAVQRILLVKMSKDHLKRLYNEITEKYKSSRREGFVEDIERETEVMMSKFSKYLHKREAMEKMAVMFRCQITKMEGKLISCNAQKYIDDIVDGYVKKYSMNDEIKTEIMKIKNVNESPKIFDKWLKDLDEETEVLENTWDSKMRPFSKTCQDTQECTKALISRHMGEVDKNTYMIEYNPKTDGICTIELQNQVNSQQKYVLKNIIKNESLNFPNLIRGFLISICFVLKNTEIGDEIYTFNEYLENTHLNFAELVSAMKILLERVAIAEGRLQPSPLAFNNSYKPQKQLTDLPPIPDLSDVKSTRNLQNNVLFDTFTPLNTSKHQFNLLRKSNNTSFTKPHPRSILVTPFHHGPKDDFLRSIISCRVSAYDQQNTSNNFHNISIMSQATKANETIAECGTGFTKHQIMRLLSTKKSSSSKKFKYNTERPSINVKKGGLFNESNISSESNGLFRSYSSPNLFENREKRSLSRGRRRKLSIMQENSPSMLEVSGIVALEKDSSYGTPQGVELSRKLIDSASLPVISITPDPEQKMHDMLKEIGSDFNRQSDVVQSDISTDIEEAKTDTPKTNTQLIRKTSSLEKIINRFKKVRANVVHTEDNVDTNEFRTIVEEKENLNMVNVNVYTANRILLPDLLSPSCSGLSRKSKDYLDQICFEMDEKVRKKPRESLGTALGVDQTFLDQFDLID